MSPPITSTVLGDINARIRSNRREQDSYTTPLQRYMDDKDKHKKKGSQALDDAPTPSGMYRLAICHDARSTLLTSISYTTKLPIIDIRIPLS
jgi:hypothetical protein